MRKLYLYCGIVLCLIAACLVFLTLQPKYFPLDEYVPRTPPETRAPADTSGEVPPETLPPVTEPAETEPSVTDPTETAPRETDPPETVPPETEPPEPYLCPAELKEANGINPDVYAWISVPGTNIDFPVIQSPTDDSRYLRRDINGNYLISGMIMTEHTYNSTTFEDPVTVIYGHCMASGAMFGNLQSYYSTPADLEKYKTVEIWLKDKKLEYEVFAAVPYDRRHILYNYDFSNPRIFSSFFRSIYAIRSFNATLAAGEKPQSGDKVLILSTCLKGDNTKRFLVMAKLVK